MSDRTRLLFNTRTLNGCSWNIYKNYRWESYQVIMIFKIVLAYFLMLLIEISPINTVYYTTKKYPPKKFHEEGTYFFILELIK